MHEPGVQQRKWQSQKRKNEHDACKWSLAKARALIAYCVTLCVIRSQENDIMMNAIPARRPILRRIAGLIPGHRDGIGYVRRP
jgi:hypothetical protein